MSDPKITRVVSSVGTTRTLEMDDGSIITRSGGTVSWRNNNPGNLKFEFAGSADKTVNNPRTREQALEAAQNRYQGVVGLDQWVTPSLKATKPVGLPRSSSWSIASLKRQSKKCCQVIQPLITVVAPTTRNRQPRSLRKEIDTAWICARRPSDR
ncbi:hypothetical protein JWH11_03475 [Xanthomonas melonis]|uniref:Uncharacterized protein n=1 Tax=Xanthomonas melonis TaxID=56456 RepID=A0ABS8NT93_9XANT|nr:hypothetical protein [Xanthomonas melonis]MCD0257240.1 hypothetical protein [Xanthomonas melonis]MCD0265510.1 hypothetical protein [Xanthomonas melonis]